MLKQAQKQKQTTKASRWSKFPYKFTFQIPYEQILWLLFLLVRMLSLLDETTKKNYAMRGDSEKKKNYEWKPKKEMFALLLLSVAFRLTSMTTERGGKTKNAVKLHNCLYMTLSQMYVIHESSMFLLLGWNVGWIHMWTSWGSAENLNIWWNISLLIILHILHIWLHSMLQATSRLISTFFTAHSKVITALDILSPRRISRWCDLL